MCFQSRAKCTTSQVTSPNHWGLALVEESPGAERLRFLKGWGWRLSAQELPEAVLPQATAVFFSEPPRRSPAFAVSEDLLDLDADAGDAGRTAAVVAGRLSEVMAPRRIPPFPRGLSLSPSPFNRGEHEPWV